MYSRRLSDLRVDHDLTQQQVADILGRKREVYRRYAKGMRAIPVDFLIKQADYYGVSVDHIWGREWRPEFFYKTCLRG